MKRISHIKAADINECAQFDEQLKLWLRSHWWLEIERDTGRLSLIMD